MVHKDSKKPSIIKWIVATIILISLIIGGSFIGGTFYPNSWTVEKIENEFHKKELNEISLLGLEEPEFDYSDKKTFISATKKCVDYLNFTTDRMSRVPTSIVIAMAGVESGWGTSRFATEGNNLFGIRTFSKNVPHMTPLGIKKWPGWGVRIFASKCDSVKEYIRLLNEHPAYAEFREARQIMLKNNTPLDPIVLIKTLDKFSTTADYDQRVIRIINKVRKLEGTYASDKNIK